MYKWIFTLLRVTTIVIEYFKLRMMMGQLFGKRNEKRINSEPRAADVILFYVLPLVLLNPYFNLGMCTAVPDRVGLRGL